MELKVIKARKILVVLLLLYTALFLASFSIGRYSDVNLETLLKVFAYRLLNIGGKDWNPIAENIIFEIRMPRIISASLVGASLSISGVLYQALFSNPMASPDTLGVSSGAGLGAAIGILLGFSNGFIQGSAFITGCVAVVCAVVISRLISRGQSVAVFLILTGMVISSFASALLSIIKYIADPLDQLPAITYWLMGSFRSVTNQDNVWLGLVFICCFILVFMSRWRLNLLLLPEQEAKSVGGEIRKLRIIVILTSTLLTACSISVAGGVGWVGLIVPHIIRIIIGNDLRYLIPLSSVFGATYLLLMDDIARYVLPAEVPIGILTAIIGAPLFFAVLIKNRRGVVDD